MFPIMLQLKGRPCLVVGGGGVALRKALSLVEEGARVKVVAPEAVESLEHMAADGRITLEKRPYRPGEVIGNTLVFTATDSREVNRQVYEDAHAAGIWVNAADEPESCSFHLSARIQRDHRESGYVTLPDKSNYNRILCSRFMVYYRLELLHHRKANLRYHCLRFYPSSCRAKL